MPSWSLEFSCFGGFVYQVFVWCSRKNYQLPNNDVKNMFFVSYGLGEILVKLGGVRTTSATKGFQHVVGSLF